MEDYKRRTSILENELNKTQKNLSIRERDIYDIKNSMQEYIDEIASLKVKLSEVRALNANMELLINGQQDRINSLKTN
jgi:chromosome segregation ATPase